MKNGRLYKVGFRAIRKSSEAKGLISLPVAATTTIVKDQVIFSSSGYAAGGTAFSTLAIGIAAESVSNAAGSAGDKNVLVIPFDPTTQYIVPVEANAKISQAVVGLRIDLESATTVDISDTTVVGFAFEVDAIDISTEAIAANTYGYAIGRILSV